MASGSSTPWRHQTSKWFVGVAQKAHIRSTSQVILSDTETTNRGFLCLAPIGRLACMTTRSSRSFCSALRSIRQSNNANESCTNDLWGIAPGRSGKSCQRAGTDFRPARQQLIYRMFSLHGKRSLHIFCDNSAAVGSLPLGVNLSTIPGRACDSCLVISSSERPDF